MSINKKKKQNTINQFKNSIASIKNFLNNKDDNVDECCECGSAACLWHKYDQYNSSNDDEPYTADDTLDDEKDAAYNVELSNVVFFPSTYADHTAVYVDNKKITGVSKATLEHDAELGLAVLKLEIIAPQISSTSN